MSVVFYHFVNKIDWYWVDFFITVIVFHWRNDQPLWLRVFLACCQLLIFRNRTLCLTVKIDNFYKPHNLFNVNRKRFSKIYSLIAEIQKFKKLNLKTSVSNMWTPIAGDGEFFTFQQQSAPAHHWYGRLIPQISVQSTLKSGAQATLLPHQDTRHRPSEAATGWRMASLQSGHHRLSSETVAC